MIISKDEYAGWSDQDKQVAVQGIQREMIRLKENQEFIQEKIKPFVDKGNKPSELVAVLSGLYEPFLPDVYRRRYPPVDKAVIEVTFLTEVIRHAREYKWDPSGPAEQYWIKQNEDKNFPLPYEGAPLYIETAIDLENQKLEENEFTILVCSHGCASVFKAAIARAETTAELDHPPPAA